MTLSPKQGAHTLITQSIADADILSLTKVLYSN